MAVFLIDETDTGFYILKSRDAKRAMYIPRGVVSLIYFGDEGPDSK
jgi:hypothetical protein